jgi:hypothetical protein
LIRPIEVKGPIPPRLKSSKAHADHLGLYTVANGADFHYAVAAGVDEIFLPPGDVDRGSNAAQRTVESLRSTYSRYPTGFDGQSWMSARRAAN